MVGTVRYNYSAVAISFKDSSALTDPVKRSASSPLALKISPRYKNETPDLLRHMGLCAEQNRLPWMRMN